MLGQENGSELVLDNALTLSLVSSLYSVGFYCRQTSLLSRENIIPFPVWLAMAKLILANFTSLLCCRVMICAKVFIHTEFDNHIVVENMAARGHQNEPDKNVGDTRANIGLVQSGRPCAHREY